MATISTHTGSSVSRGHNVRDERCISKDDHIDLSRPHEVWVDEAPRHAYDRLFGQSVREYNKQQKRADRRIDNYYNLIRDDGKKHPVYEMIVGVYPADGESIPDIKNKFILRNFVNDWKERNPNLEMIGAYYHADEQGKAPHVHIDYIPVAHGYKKGMETQTGLDRALREQGFNPVSKTVTPQIQWERRENEYLESLCNRLGVSVEHPQAGHGVKHLHTLAYKAEQELQEKKDVLSADVERMQAKEQELKNNIATLQQEEGRARSSVEMLRKFADSKQEQIEQLKEKYRELESAPPIRKVIEVPVERIVEVETEVLVEKVVEVETNYKTMAEAALNAFRTQSEWLEKKGLSAESYNDLCHDTDFLRTNKTIYPRNRARVEPLHPDGETSQSKSFHR